MFSACPSSTLWLFCLYILLKDMFFYSAAHSLINILVPWKGKRTYVTVEYFQHLIKMSVLWIKVQLLSCCWGPASLSQEHSFTSVSFIHIRCAWARGQRRQSAVLRSQPFVCFHRRSPLQSVNILSVPLLKLIPHRMTVEKMRVQEGGFCSVLLVLCVF